ncbi:zinc-ribbon domain-containing protein [Nocardia sp. BMG111209]|uniref:zinc-ribbon domain-containing protein n=1 Tax=Nocardia sp. BMG111209 TaxID=1160137 RepID=UPI0003769DEB|nr:zinc-ribbon domain-containing protein [Nocardia sp. BMG111209]
MLIWGWRRSVTQLAMITLVCGNCHNPAAHTLRKVVTWFTLFFIPLIPLSTKHTLQCTFCGAPSDVPKDRVPEMLALAQGVPPQQQPPQPYQQPWGAPAPAMAQPNQQLQQSMPHQQQPQQPYQQPGYPQQQQTYRQQQPPYPYPQR